MSKEPFPLSAYIMMIAQGIGISCAVVSVSIAVLTAQYITGDVSLSTIAYGLQFFTLFASIYLISMLMSRFGRRPIFILAGVAGTLVAPTGFFAIELLSFPLLILAHVCLGVFLAAIQLYRYAILDITPASRQASAVSLIMLGGVIASFLGPTILRHSDLFASDLYRGGYIAIGLLSLTVTFLIATVRFPSSHTKKQETIHINTKTLLANPILLFAAFTGGMVYGVMNAIMSVSTLHMQHHGFAIPAISIAIQWHVFAMFAPSLISGFLIRKLGITLFLIAGILSMIASACVGLFEPLYHHFFISLLLLGIGWNFLYVGATYLVGHHFQGKEKFKAQGISDTIVHFCSASFGLSAGLLLATLSWQGMQILSISMMAAVFLFLALLYNKYFRPTSQPT